ncbi:MAG: RNA methyltransferase [Alistipes sp.]|nr:RNA methyltransferase [Candidatus Alistipes equi]
MTNTENELTLDEIERQTNYLLEFMLSSRAETLKQCLRNRTKYMTIATENMFHEHNASAVIRHCDAFGIQSLHTVEKLCPFAPSLHITRGSEKWIDIHRHSSTSQLISSLKEEGYRIIATSPHEGGSTPETFDIKKGPFAIVLGTEKTGISDEIKKNADEFMAIPMYGLVESLNVSATAAIITHILSERIRHEIDNWQLSMEDYIRLLFKWAKISVQDSSQILERYKNTAADS